MDMTKDAYEQTCIARHQYNSLRTTASYKIRPLHVKHKLQSTGLCINMAAMALMDTIIFGTETSTTMLDEIFRENPCCFPSLPKCIDLALLHDMRMRIRPRQGYVHKPGQD
jgi:hypothetical protein